MVSDIIADSLARIKNALSRQRSEVTLLYSKLMVNVCEILKQTGYIVDYRVNDVNDFKKEIVVFIDQSKVVRKINDVKKISKPGRRIYRGYSEISQIKDGYGIAIISTPKGVITDIDARKQRVGGEVLCHIY